MITKAELSTKLGYKNVSSMTAFLKRYYETLKISHLKKKFTDDEVIKIENMKNEIYNMQTHNLSIANNSKKYNNSHEENSNKMPITKNENIELNVEMFNKYCKKHYQEGVNINAIDLINAGLKSRNNLVRTYDSHFNNESEKKLTLHDLCELFNIDITNLKDNETYINLGRIYKGIEQNAGDINKIIKEYIEQSRMQQLREENERLKKENEEYKNRHNKFRQYVPRKDYVPKTDDEINNI